MQLCELPELEVIDLSHNKIAQFPKTLALSLKALILDHNRISEVPNYVGFLPNLIKLVVDDNPITYPPKSVVTRSKSLTELEWLVALKEWLANSTNRACSFARTE